MGRAKQLLPLNNKPIIRHCVETILESGINDVIVVVGTQDNGIAAACTNLPVTIAVNDKPGSEMSDSVRCGLTCITAFSAVLLSLADHPLVTSETIKTLVSHHISYPETIIIPEFEGKRGHPTLFPRSVINQLFFYETLRDIIRRNQSRVKTIAVGDEGVILDMDTPDDYKRILARYRELKCNDP